MQHHKYRTIIDHYEDCLARHGDSNLGVDWPNTHDAAKRYCVMLDVVRDNSVGLTLLDFGCGASHLYPTCSAVDLPALSITGLMLRPPFANYPTANIHKLITFV